MLHHTLSACAVAFIFASTPTIVSADVWRVQLGDVEVFQRGQLTCQPFPAAGSIDLSHFFFGNASSTQGSFATEIYDKDDQLVFHSTISSTHAAENLGAAFTQPQGTHADGDVSVLEPSFVALFGTTAGRFASGESF